MRKGGKNQFFRAPRTARSADSGTAHGQIAVQEIFLRRYGIARSACADAGLDGAGVGSPMQASSHRPLTRAERRAAADRTCVHTTSRPHAAPSNTTDHPCLRSGGEVADRRRHPSPGPSVTCGWIPSRGVRLGARLAISRTARARLRFLVAPDAAWQRSGRAGLHYQADGVAIRATRRTFPTPSAPGEPGSERPARESVQRSDRSRLRDERARH